MLPVSQQPGVPGLVFGKVTVDPEPRASAPLRQSTQSAVSGGHEADDLYVAFGTLRPETGGAEHAGARQEDENSSWSSPS